MKPFIGALALVFVATTARAQVGHLPENSPYRDLETRQEFTFFGGQYSAGQDLIGVAPRGGPMFGLRYDIHVGGPAFLAARWSHVNGERFPIDPKKTGAARQLAKQSTSLNLYDIDLAINLTGQKSYHHLVPVINLGGGIATCGCTVANDPYKFGTPFAFSFGGGLHYVPGGRLQLALDWSNFLYQLKYPPDYYVNTGNGAAVPPDQSRTFWKNNRAFTLGASLLIFR